jgi:hypothetical protein
MATPTQILTAQIESVRAEIVRLEALSLDERLKAHVKRASRDLEKAAEWLRSDNFDNRPHLQRVARFPILLAKARLKIVSYTR